MSVWAATRPTAADQPPTPTSCTICPRFSPSMFRANTSATRLTAYRWGLRRSLQCALLLAGGANRERIHADRQTHSTSTTPAGKPQAWRSLVHFTYLTPPWRSYKGGFQYFLDNGNPAAMGVRDSNAPFLYFAARAGTYDDKQQYQISGGSSCRPYIDGRGDQSLCGPDVHQPPDVSDSMSPAWMASMASAVAIPRARTIRFQTKWTT